MDSKLHIFTILAAEYDCNAYGAGAYNDTNCATTTEQTQDNGSTVIDDLANTGYNVIIPVALGAALIIAGLILLTKKLLRRK